MTAIIVEHVLHIQLAILRFLEIEHSQGAVFGFFVGDGSRVDVFVFAEDIEELHEEASVGDEEDLGVFLLQE